VDCSADEEAKLQVFLISDAHWKSFREELKTFRAEEPRRVGKDEAGILNVLIGNIPSEFLPVGRFRPSYFRATEVYLHGERAGVEY